MMLSAELLSPSTSWAHQHLLLLAKKKEAQENSNRKNTELIATLLEPILEETQLDKLTMMTLIAPLTSILLINMALKRRWWNLKQTGLRKKKTELLQLHPPC